MFMGTNAVASWGSFECNYFLANSPPIPPKTTKQRSIVTSTLLSLSGLVKKSSQRIKRSVFQIRSIGKREFYPTTWGFLCLLAVHMFSSKVNKHKLKQNQKTFLSILSFLQEFFSGEDQRSIFRQVRLKVNTSGPTRIFLMTRSMHPHTSVKY